MNDTMQRHAALPPLPQNPYDCLHQGCLRPWEVDSGPFPVAERTWYVGNNWVGAYLLESSEGLILIDTTMQPQVYLVTENIRRLGFDPADIRLILLSHMHYDHVGGVRALQELSGARVMMSREDWDFLQTRPEQLMAEGYPMGEFRPDAFFADDTPVVLGDRTIRTMLTPGHTPGTTSFFFHTGDKLCGLHGGVGLNTLSDEALADAGLGTDMRDRYLASMLRLRDMPVAITLGSHPAQVAMMDRVSDIRDGHNPFHDPAVWPRLIDARIGQIRALMEQAA